MVALSVMIFTATVTVLVGLKEAPSSFAANRGFVISSPGAATVFSSSVDEELAHAIDSSVQHASPEVFAFSSRDGVPFVVRGVDLEMLEGTGPAFLSLERSDGETGLDGCSALIGARLKERLSLDPPSNISITSSYSSSFHVVRVVGWFESRSALDDELLVSLDLARSLSGMADGKVSIIRVGGADPALQEILMPSGPEFAVYDLRASVAQTVSGEQFSVEVTVKNWGTESGRVNLTVTEEFAGEENSVWAQELRLNASQELRLSRQVTLTQEGPHTINATVGGQEKSSQTVTISIVHPYLVIDCPVVVGINTTFNLTVADYAGNLIEGAEVRFAGQVLLTDDLGRVSFSALTLGDDVPVTASFPGFSNRTANVTVVDFDTYPNEFKPMVMSFGFVPYSMEFNEKEPGTISVTVWNDGRLPGNFVASIILDGGEVFARLNISLGPGDWGQASYTLAGIDPGQHSLSLDDQVRQFTVQPWYADDEDLVLLAVRYGGAAHLSSVGSIPIAQAAKISQGDIEVALLSIGAISATLAALSVTSIFSKEVHENRSKLGVLRTIGASHQAVRKLVVRQSLVYSVPGALAGAVLGLAVALLMMRWGVLWMFGHALTFDMDAQVVLAILVGIVSICLVSSLVSAGVAVRATPISSIRGTEEESQGRRTVDEVLGIE